MNVSDETMYAQEIQSLRNQNLQEQTRRVQLESQMGQTSSFSNPNNSDAIKFQLDLSEDLEKIEHFLKSDILMEMPDKNIKWVRNPDEKQITFSDFGVSFIMEQLQFYTKNIVLGNYDMDIIMKKIHKFAHELNDYLYESYEDVLYYKSPEEIFEFMEQRLKKGIINGHVFYYDPDDLKTEKISKFIDVEVDGMIVRRITNEFVHIFNKGKEWTEMELYMKCMQWSKEQMEEKHKKISSMIFNITNYVHGSYNRALKGEDRRTIRQNLNVNQSLQPSSSEMPQRKVSILRPSTW